VPSLVHSLFVLLLLVSAALPMLPVLLHVLKIASAVLHFALAVVGGALMILPLPSVTGPSVELLGLQSVLL
jgi:hypothetical protein